MSNKRNYRTGFNLLLTIGLLVLIVFSHSQTVAKQSDFNAQSLTAGSRYVRTGAEIAMLTERVIDDRLEGLVNETAVSIIVTYVEPFDLTQLQAIPDSQIVNTYQRMKGVSMIVPGDQIMSVTQLPNITGVYADELQQVEATVSQPSADITAAQTAVDATAGAGTLFAAIDTGVWPEHPSFAELNSAAMPDVGTYPCEFGNTAWQPDDAPFACNNKLVGAYTFLDTYKALQGLTAVEFDSARDDHGHGTHTTTSAVGNADVPAAVAGTDMGTISGVAPQAQVIAYKVCGGTGCYASDALAAIEQAIIDDVDVINYAIGGSNSPYNDIISLAFLDAYNNDIFVARAAGNNGPEPDTLSEQTPWVTT
ncbi:MAG: hypothetical protein DWQ04_25705, partial [Chloroflexi bacterium]